MVVMAPDDCFVENEREQQQQKIQETSDQYEQISN
jgi:hypothetical protein